MIDFARARGGGMVLAALFVALALGWITSRSAAASYYVEPCISGGGSDAISEPRLPDTSFFSQSKCHSADGMSNVLKTANTAGPNQKYVSWKFLAPPEASITGASFEANIMDYNGWVSKVWVTGDGLNSRRPEATDSRQKDNRDDWYYLPTDELSSGAGKAAHLKTVCGLTSCVRTAAAFVKAKKVRITLRDTTNPVVKLKAPDEPVFEFQDATIGIRLSDGGGGVRSWMVRSPNTTVERNRSVECDATFGYDAENDERWREKQWASLMKPCPASLPEAAGTYFEERVPGYMLNPGDNQIEVCAFDVGPMALSLYKNQEKANKGCEVVDVEVRRMTNTYFATGGDGRGRIKIESATETGHVGWACSGWCTEQYPEGSVVTLVAAPDSRSTFKGWRGACARQKSRTCKAGITRRASIKAIFAKKKSAAPSPKAVPAFRAKPRTLVVCVDPVRNDDCSLGRTQPGIRRLKVTVSKEAARKRLRVRLLCLNPICRKHAGKARKVDRVIRAGKTETFQINPPSAEYFDEARYLVGRWRILIYDPKGKFLGRYVEQSYSKDVSQKGLGRWRKTGFQCLKAGARKVTRKARRPCP
jgi:hypothetical protein